ncbi:hypothetical protein HII36_03800 [Nonomuraea sp. NN258]|uniref:sensor histidine kinase n=1 Tax=Nonomuraea antri TaxID=2730852 RepID=UPI001567C9A5|nr:histidine kinase [Nonomuraea antri]NRQ30957.1 hypothetical protein [Nonomuraea antri]
MNLDVLARLRESYSRVRHASKLDKVRWMVLYSSDITILLSLMGFVDLYIRWQKGMWPPLLAVAAVLLAVHITLSFRVIRIAVGGGPRPARILATTGVIVLLLSIFPLVWVIPTWLGTLAPFVRRRTIVLASAASVAATNLYVTLADEFQPAVLLTQTVLTALCAAALPANMSLWRVAKEAHEGQEAKARLAVSEERLRFARDLNALLGQSLSDISARALGASRVLAADPGTAAQEMFEVRELARQSLREVRTTVQNYRALDLDEVLSSVRAVLEAADVRCTVRAATADLTPEARTLLATVVREGATNVLKHSKAERCTITIEDGVLEMSNDGVTGPVGEHAPIGLAGLAQRLNAAGGTLEAAPAPGGSYLLRAAVPA